MADRRRVTSDMYESISLGCGSRNNARGFKVLSDARSLTRSGGSNWRPKSPKRQNACICPLENQGLVDACTPATGTCAENWGVKKSPQKMGSGWRRHELRECRLLP